MFTKKVLVSALFVVGTIGAVGTPLTSMAQVEIQLNMGPPPLRYEVVPAPRSGYVWTRGHWQWRGNQHVWVAGNWQAERSGYRYGQPAWVEREGAWQYRASRWDKDGDGVPNNQDRRPNDPTRR